MAVQRDAGLLNKGAATEGVGKRGIGSIPRCETNPTLTEAGINKTLADRARKYAAIPEGQFEDLLADRRDRIEQENARVTINLLQVGEAEILKEAKDIRDKAEAMRAYARQAKNKQLEVDAAEIRILSERRLGELMASQRDAGLLSEGGRPKTGSGPDPVNDDAPTLAEAGIDKHLADRARNGGSAS